MAKKFKTFLPFLGGLLALFLLLGARAWGLSLMSEDGRWPNVEGGMYTVPVMKDGVNYFVPPDELYENGLGKDGIPALTTATYITVSAADDILADEVEGIDVEVNGEHRFYSFQILNWHGMVNDHFGGKDLLVSYGTLCGSAVVYDRTLDGTSRTFGDAGFVYNSCPVLYDSASSVLWNQATGSAIVGDGGKTLARYPSVVMRWDAWKAAYPYGEVLSTETGSVRDYRRHPYGNYDNNTSLYFPVNKLDTRLGTKDVVYDLVFGDVHVGGTAKFLSFVKEPNYTTAQVSYTAFVGDDNVLRFFERTVEGQVLTFIREGNEIRDKETDSVWTEEGECVRGEFRGEVLTEIHPSARYFAFAFVSQFPTAELLGNELFEGAADANAAEPIEINVTE